MFYNQKTTLTIRSTRFFSLSLSPRKIKRLAMAYNFIIKNLWQVKYITKNEKYEKFKKIYFTIGGCRCAGRL